MTDKFDIPYTIQHCHILSTISLEEIAVFWFSLTIILLDFVSLSSKRLITGCLDQSLTKYVFFFFQNSNTNPFNQGYLSGYLTLAFATNPSVTHTLMSSFILTEENLKDLNICDRIPAWAKFPIRFAKSLSLWGTTKNPCLTKQWQHNFSLCLSILSLHTHMFSRKRLIILFFKASLHHVIEILSSKLLFYIVSIM